MNALRALALMACLVALPGALLAQERDRQKAAPPPRDGAQAEPDRKARPRSPEAERPREQPQQPRSREPQLKRRKP